MYFWIMAFFVRNIWILFFGLLTQFVFGQEPVFVHLEEKDALPDKAFYDVVEDDNGIIWLAADTGLYRYDGFSYQLLSHPEQKGLSVFNLTKDQNNRVWFTNLSNQLFVIKDGKVTLFGNYNDFLEGSLASLTSTPTYIIVSSEKYILIIDKNTKEVVYKEKTRIHVKPFLYQHNLYFGVSIKGKKEVFYKMNLQTFQSTRIGNLEKDFDSFRQGLGTRIHDETIFFVSGVRKKKFFKLTKENTIISLKHQLPDYRIISIKTINDELWLCTEKGIFICTVVGEDLIIKNHFLKNEFTSQIIKDSFDNFWITTTNNGAFVIPNTEIKAVTLPSENDAFKRMFLGNNGHLVFSTIKYNLLKFHPSEKELQTIKLPYPQDIRYAFYNPYTQQYNVEIEVYGYAFLDKNFQFLEHKKSGINIKDHDFIDEEKILVSLNTSFSILTNHTSKLLPKNSIYEDNKRSYTCLYDDVQQQSYYSTTKGLFVVDASDKVTEIKYNDESLFIKKMVQSNDGRIWCLSFKKGIFVLENQQVVATYTTKNGLLSNFNSYIATTENQVWIAGNKGLQQIDFLNNTIRNLTKNDGIPSYEFTGLAIQNHQVYVSTLKKLCFFDTRKVFKTTRNIQPYFTAVEIADSVYAPTSEVYQLSHHQNKLKFKFNTNGFLSKGNINYMYKLSNVDTDWQKGTLGVNEVLYNSLPAGKFVFELRAYEGKNVSETIAVRFEISEVFYKTWWFYLLVAMVLVSIAWYVFFSINKRKNERQENLLKQQTKDLENIRLKLESLRSQMNPHFIFNALNSIQDYIIQNEKSLARRFLVKFSELIRMYLEHSQRDTISISEEIAALKLYLELEKERFEATFNYDLIVDESLKNSQLPIPTFLIQPYIENAIVHGLLHKEDHRKLDISFVLNTQTNTITCTITDNGIGRAASENINKNRPFKPKSFSTMANQKRIDLLNKTNSQPIILQIIDNFEAGEASGTTVILNIPTQQA